jgi:hypothetical protein
MLCRVEPCPADNTKYIVLRHRGLAGCRSSPRARPMVWLGHRAVAPAYHCSWSIWDLASGSHIRLSDASA